MSQSIELQMLDALEFLHYSSYFRDHLFIMVLEEKEKLRNIITDLRTLRGVRIKTLLICPDHRELPGSLELWNRRGHSFRYFKLSSSQVALPESIETLRQSLENDEIPAIALDDQPDEFQTASISGRLTAALKPCFTTKKIFFLSDARGLIVDQKFISHLTLPRVDDYLADSRQVNIGKERLRSLAEQSQLNGVEIIILPAESGGLFQEVFTHKGKGTLITNDYPNIIRPAKISDVMDIFFLMKPYIQSGTLLETDEDQIAMEIHKHYVYSVNNSLVAAVKLNDYGDTTELGKFCTLPRYQGKGRAKELAKKMIKKALEADKKYVFALTVEPKMREFFISLGFYPCERSSLPKKWRVNYDMKRPSKAFRLDLKINRA